ncbi:MAG: 7-cyano-7-deazaguanine synthase [Candidatus Omnitrophica bacterium]|nr:7-cyano-7-deazaguanine synthase [Candidatus Omnitrophota bacterium]
MRAIKDQGNAVAVLASGGVESAALIAEALRRYQRVYPIYVRKGFQWELTELVHLRRLLRALESDGLARLTVLRVHVEEIYGSHWSFGAAATPGSKEPDSAVFLPGRNLLLLTMGGLFCGVRRIPTLWIGILKGNPFHDARAAFIQQVEALLHQSLGVEVRIAAPLKELTKVEVINRWADVPWQHTFSCIRPVRRRHCGRCQKCAERKKAFQLARIPDQTLYGH